MKGHDVGLDQNYDVRLIVSLGERRPRRLDHN
jgi:hypothetical protein